MFVRFDRELLQSRTRAIRWHHYLSMRLPSDFPWNE
jgi:hypothetical protein